MTLRFGRVMREMLETVLDLQSRPECFSSKELDLFAHEYRRALKEMRRARELRRHVDEMWREKRARQAADLAGLHSGELSNDDVNWFAGGIARNAKIVGDLL
jgi:hypothetical protein